MHEQLVHALPDLGKRVRHELGRDVLVDRRPARALVFAPERTGGGDADVHRAVRELNRLRAHPAGAGLPPLTCRMLEEGAVQLPRPAAAVGAEEDAAGAPEPQLRARPRLDVPGRVELELTAFGEAELLGALPGGAAVAGA